MVEWTETNCTAGTKIQIYTDYECKTELPRYASELYPHLPENFSTTCNDMTPQYLNESMGTIRKLVAKMETDPLNSTQYADFKVAVEPVLNISALGSVATLSATNFKGALEYLLEY